MNETVKKILIFIGISYWVFITYKILGKDMFGTFVVFGGISLVIFLSVFLRWWQEKEDEGLYNKHTGELFKREDWIKPRKTDFI